jgi:hypothetical protein
MRGSSRPRLSFLPWVEGVARQIGDPVQRLRFLRVAAPCVPRISPSQRRLRAMILPSAIAALLFFLIAATALSLSLIKGSAQPTHPPKSSSPR